MTRARYTRQLLAPLAFAMLLSCACSSAGGDDDDDGTQTPTEAQPTQSPTPTATATATATAEPTPEPTATAAPTAPPTPEKTSFDLSVVFLDMGQATNKNCYVRAVDGSGAEVGRTVQEPVLSPNFTLTLLEAVEKGQNYTIDIWVDWTQDGVYQSPPQNPQQNTTSDRSWRTYSGTVGGDTSVNFTWNPAYTDVAWPG